MEKFNIGSEKLQVTLKLTGAEMCSIIDLRDGCEHLWNAEPTYWGRHAPILFPTIGESVGGEIGVHGKQYPLGRHGFARFEKFSIIAQNAGSIRFQLLPNAETLKGFPFHFVFETEYTIVGNIIHQSFLVKNTDQVPFAFQLGGHPAFAVPCGKQGTYSDHSIVLDKKENFDRHLLTKRGLFSGEKQPFMQDTDRFDLYPDLFAEDAIVFKNEGISEASLVNNRTGKFVKMRFDGFPHLGVWSVPGAGYVCIEPWIGCADDDGGTNDLFKKDHAILLQPAETFSAEFSIEIGESTQTLLGS